MVLSLLFLALSFVPFRHFHGVIPIVLVSFSIITFPTTTSALASQVQRGKHRYSQNSPQLWDIPRTAKNYAYVTPSSTSVPYPQAKQNSQPGPYIVASQTLGVAKRNLLQRRVGTCLRANYTTKHKLIKHLLTLLQLKKVTCLECFLVRECTADNWSPSHQLVNKSVI